METNHTTVSQEARDTSASAKRRPADDSSSGVSRASTIIRRQFSPAIEGFFGAALVLVAAALSISVLYYRASRAYKDEVRENMVRIGEAAAAVIDGDLHKTIISEDQRDSPELARVIAPLRQILLATHGVKYIYTVVVRDGRAYFVADPTFGDGDDDVEIMEEYEDAPPEAFEAARGGHPVVTPEPYSDDWGTFMTAWVPFLDSSGAQSGIVGVDVTADHYVARVSSVRNAAVAGIATALAVSVITGIGVALIRSAALRTDNLRLAAQERLYAYAAELGSAYVQLEAAKAEVEEASRRDFLTGLHNRRFFLETAGKIYATAARGGLSLAIAMIDIDYFKKINDTHGHAGGDAVLKQVSKILVGRFRTADIVARFGGEEFCIACGNMDGPQAMIVFEELRAEIARTKYPFEGTEVPVSVSIGLCTERMGSLDEMINAADACLYHAKKSGRDRVAAKGE